MTIRISTRAVAARRAVAGLIALALAVSAGVLGASGAARAEGEVPAPATGSTAPLTASLVSVAPAYLTPSTSLSVRVAVTAGERALTGVQSVVAITDAPLATASAVDAFLDQPDRVAMREVGRGQPAEFLQGVPRAPGSLDAGSAATTSLLISSGSLNLPRGTSGVYGVSVTTIADGVPAVRNAFVITWTDSVMPPVDVAVLATVGGSPERATALLNAANDYRVALAVDGAVLPLLDPHIADLTGREVFAIPAGHLDLSSAAHADAGGLVSFAVQRSQSAGEERPWLAVPGTIDQAVVDLADAQGAAAILAGTKLEFGRPEAAGSLAAATASSGRQVPIAMAHSRLSASLATSPTTDPTAPARLVAETALLSLDPARMGRGEPVLVAPGESWIVDGTRPSDELAAMYSAPWVRPAQVADVLASAPAEVQVATLAPAMGDVAPEWVDAIGQHVTRLADLAAATDQPQLILDGPGRSLMAAMSLPMRGDAEARDEAVAAALDEAKATLHGVRVTSRSEVTLVSSSGKIPVTVRNDLPASVTVVVAMTTASPRLLIDEQPVATLEPGTEQTVFVPITAVSSGNVMVSVALRGEDGSALSSSQAFKVRVRAEWGNVATGVATAALVVLLIAGVWRTIRRGRRDTRIGPMPSEPHGRADAEAQR